MSGQNCLLTERDIGAPLVTLANSLVRLAYFHTNSLLTGLNKTETEICWRKDDNKIKKQTYIDCHGPKPSSNSSQSPNPPPFSLTTSGTFKECTEMHLLTIKAFWHFSTTSTWDALGSNLEPNQWASWKASRQPILKGVLWPFCLQKINVYNITIYVIWYWWHETLIFW